MRTIITIILLAAVLFQGAGTSDNVDVGNSKNEISIIHLNDMQFKSLYIKFYNNNLVQDYPLILLQHNIYPRAFVHIKNGISNIYLNKDGYFFDDRDYQLLIEHEYYHTDGREHELTGIMSPNPFIRYLTS